MRRPNDMTDYERLIFEAFERDPGIAYDLSDDEQQILLGLVGEQDSLVDAIMKNSGASKRARAEMLGCNESDFDYED